VPTDVKATVEDGWITLCGEVTWEFQRKMAADAVRYLDGVRGVSNEITIWPREPANTLEKLINQALKRNADIDPDGIVVSAEGSKVILSGTVRTFAERDGAERVAWSAPGVSGVENKLIVLW
jgi:osmotically-inducible protein OsmY